jgi:hypothetical protein
MTKHAHHHTLRKSDLLDLFFYSISDIDVNELGWWLETKTEKQFTVIQTEIIKDLFKLLNTQEAQLTLFKEVLFKNLGYLKRQIDSDDFLKKNDR